MRQVKWQAIDKTTRRSLASWDYEKLTVWYFNMDGTVKQNTAENMEMPGDEGKLTLNLNNSKGKEFCFFCYKRIITNFRCIRP